MSVSTVKIGKFNFVCFRVTEPSFIHLTDHLGLDSLLCVQLVAEYVGPGPMHQGKGFHTGFTHLLNIFIEQLYIRHYLEH